MAVVKKVFDIGGMHCGSCAAGIQMFLSSTDGVKNVTVDYNTKKADVEYDDAQLTVDAIVKAVEELGYTAKPAA
jgi:Cu+-exporting ATPase